MGQLVRKIQKELVLTDTAATDIDLFLGGLAGELDLIKMLRVRNNDAVTQVITVKLQTYSGGYQTTFEKDYSIAAGGFELITEFIDQSLDGDATNPDKIVVQFDTTMTGTDSIQFQGTTVQFS